MDQSIDMVIDSLHTSSSINEKTENHVIKPPGETESGVLGNEDQPLHKNFDITANLKMAKSDDKEISDEKPSTALSVLSLNSESSSENVPIITASSSMNDEMPSTLLNEQSIDDSQNIAVNGNVSLADISSSANDMCTTSISDTIPPPDFQSLVTYSIDSLTDSSEVQPKEEVNNDTENHSMENIQIVDMANNVINGDMQIVNLTNSISNGDGHGIDLSGSITPDSLQALADQVMAGTLQIVNITQDGSENGDGSDISAVVLPDNLKALANQVMAGNLQIIDFNNDGDKVTANESGDGGNSANLQLLAQEILAGNLQIVDLSDGNGDSQQTTDEKISSALQALGSNVENLNGNLQILDLTTDIAEGQVQVSGTGISTNDVKIEVSSDQLVSTDLCHTSPIGSVKNKDNKPIPPGESSIQVTKTEQIIANTISDVMTADQLCSDKALSLINVTGSSSSVREKLIDIPAGTQIVFCEPSANSSADTQMVLTDADLDNTTLSVVSNQINFTQATDTPICQEPTVISQQTIDAATAQQIILAQQTAVANTMPVAHPSIVDDCQISFSRSSSSLTSVIQPSIVTSSEIPLHELGNGILSVNGIVQSAGEAVTINLPKSTMQTLQLNGGLSMQDTPVTVLQGDYINILDAVLKNSNLTIQGENIDANQPLVLAEVDHESGEMVAVKGPDGNHITLTTEQMNAINVAAATQSVNIPSVISGDTSTQKIITKSGINSQQNMLNLPYVQIKPNTLGLQKDRKGDEMEFDNDFLEDRFEAVRSPSPGIDTIIPTENADGKLTYKCSECGRPYVSKGALKKHLIVVHGKEMEIAVHSQPSKCINPGCEKVFYHRQKMIDHLREEHGVNCVQEDLVFNSWEEFFVWKEKEEDANFVHFSKNSTHANTANYMLVNFVCQREGKAGYKYKGSQQKKYKDLVIGEKICPARMRARLDKPTGRVTVQYCKSHNHKLSFQDFLYRRMPDRIRNEIREKLLSGMSSEEIYKELKSTDNLRETRGERFAPSKRQFVTLVNIKTIAKRMQIKEAGPSKQFALDPDPYAIQVQKLVDETYNPVLLYKDQGVTIEVGPQEIEKAISNGLETLLLIGIQTKEQKDMFVKHCHKLVLIDITDDIVAPTQYIITVKVLDEYNKGYPVAFLLSNSKEETVLFYFFREMQNRVQDVELKINSVMTENSCNEYYAFRSVFGEQVKHLLCKWNLHRAWCQKIHEECVGDEALQQELYFIFVTMLEEHDLQKFESIATEFVSNYQARCGNFIQFFMSNYLSQPEVWASCYRNNRYSDCDEILYGDRLHERIKKEMKNNQQVRSVDDLLDLVMKFEHEDYFNRGLNLMLNPPEGDLVLSEHALGLKIKNSFVVENYTADNRWLVKTLKKDTSDLQTFKEESHIVTWKADICEKDFCRERCLKLTCFGLCGHLYHCSCDSTPVTPCSHIHKVHSMRIGVTQYQNDAKEISENEDSCHRETLQASAPRENLIVSITEEKKKDDGKVNLVNPASNMSFLEQEIRSREEKVRKIKYDLVKLYKFLESENIQKYSLDFIDTGLRKVIDECKIIESIGQNKTMGSCSQGKRKTMDEDLLDFDLVVKHSKRRKVMGNSVPVIVEIEPNPSTYNTFRKRANGVHDETQEDRMLKLSRSKSITVNIESDEKYRISTSQQVTSTPGIIIAKESKPILAENHDTISVPTPDVTDTEWTPKGTKKRGRPARPLSEKKTQNQTLNQISEQKQIKTQNQTLTQNQNLNLNQTQNHSSQSQKNTTGRKTPGPKKRKSKISKGGVWKMVPLDRIPDPLKYVIRNGSISLTMTQIKTLDSSVTPLEIEKCKAFSPGWDCNNIPESIIDSFFYTLSQKYNILSLTVEQMTALCSNKPPMTRFWDPEELIGEKCCSYIFVPWKNPLDYFSLFVIDLMNHCISYLDSGNVLLVKSEVDILPSVNRAHTTLVGLMITEIPFDSTREKQLTWPLTIDSEIEFDCKDHSIRCLWYAHQLCNNTSLTDTSVTMMNFRKEVYDAVVGKCLEHVIEDSLTFCPVCSFDGNTAIECSRCNQMYHSTCLRGVDIDSFVCTV